MKSVKIKIGLIIALCLAFIVSLGSFIGLMVTKADRAVSVGGSAVFNLTGEAAIWAHRVEHKITGADGSEKDDPYYYTMFAFENDDDAVNYRRNLAYNWFYDKNDCDDYLPDAPRKGEDGYWWIRNIKTKILYDPSQVTEVVDGYWVIGGVNTGVKEKADFVSPVKAEGYLNLEIGFEEVNFEKFTVAFETQQFSMTEDEKTVNYIIFIPVKDGGAATGRLYAVITDDKDAAEKSAEDIPVGEDAVSLGADRIVIRLSAGGAQGEYGVEVFNASAEEIPEEKIQRGTFYNVGKSYARNVSSSTSPVIPLSFKADMPEKEEGDDSVTKARMALYSLNGQSFVLNRNSSGETGGNYTQINEVDDGNGKHHYTGGQVNDLMPPVLCLDSDINYIAEGSELKTSGFVAVDVLSQNSNTETGYFILTKEQAAAEGFNADDYTAENLYRLVNANNKDDDQYIIPHANAYVPKEGDYAEGSFGEDFTPEAAIKIYVKLSDTSAAGRQSTYIMLDWYLGEQYKLTVGGYDYIAVASDSRGAHYNSGYTGTYEYTDEDGDTFSVSGWEALIKEYQHEVDEAAENLSAGGDDFYLPSLEKLIVDNATSYRDMTYSVYYMVNGSKSSATGKTSDRLSLELDAAGDYLFTIYAQDAVSNKMWYEKKVEGAENEVVEFEASEIWDIFDDEKLHDMLPWFKFSAGVSEITIEEPEEQSTAYVGSSYSAGSFEIKGISTKATYTLYRFDNPAYAADHDGQVLSYGSFMETKKELFEGEGRKYFTNIVAASMLEEGTEEYELFNDYAWNPETRTFTPRDENTFYLIKCEVTSTQFPDMDAVKEYMGIAASVTPKALDGENTWVRDNMVSIILLSIAGAAFIGIILLLVIKPKQKTDIDVRFEQENAAKQDKADKKAK